MRRTAWSGAVLFLSLTLTAGRVLPAEPEEPAVRAPHIEEHLLDTKVERHVRLPYLLFLPDDYGRSDDTRWPLILYLHGALGRGEDFDKLSWYPLPRLLREPGREIPFVVLMPQCPPEQNWLDDDALIALLDEVTSSHAIDANRVYLAGYSMGAMGAWHLAAAHPDRFAALGAMSGLANPLWAPRLAHMPVWVFHGARDERIPPRESEAMVETLRALGAEVRFSLDPERGHRPPDDEEHMKLFSWFLEHRRPERTGEVESAK